MAVGRTDSGVWWVEFRFKTGPAGSRTGYKRRRGGGRIAETRRRKDRGPDALRVGIGQTENSRRGNGNRRNYNCCRRNAECRREAAKLLAASGRRHDAIFYVGVLNLSERHSGTPPEIDF